VGGGRDVGCGAGGDYGGGRCLGGGRRWGSPGWGFAGGRVWGKAVFVPGLGALNRGGSAEADSVSCSSAANCAAVGSYKVRRRDVQGLVVAERHGRWGRAIRVPGLTALNKGGQAGVLSVSCPSAGNCAARGDYRASGDRLGFVVSEKRGVWGRAIEMPGLRVLDQGGNASFSQISCGSAGNCAVGGTYTDSDGHH
jgi:hypothetical protein